MDGRIDFTFKQLEKLLLEYLYLCLIRNACPGLRPLPHRRTSTWLRVGLLVAVNLPSTVRCAGCSIPPNASRWAPQMGLSRPQRPVPRPLTVHKVTSACLRLHGEWAPGCEGGRAADCRTRGTTPPPRPARQPHPQPSRPQDCFPLPRPLILIVNISSLINIFWEIVSFNDPHKPSKSLAPAAACKLLSITGNLSGS